MSEHAANQSTPASAKNASSTDLETASAKQDARKTAPDLADIFPFSVSVGSVYDGPLDLLLDLIRKQDIDIYDIPIAQITAQYLAYVEHIRNFDIDLAAEFIYTASLLIQIKSRMLLPKDLSAQITAQYLAYVEHIRNFDIDLAAEFIYTASLLIQIKSRMLLPKDPSA